MMVCGLLHLVVLSSFCTTILATSSGAGNRRYRTSGPMMCQQICGEFISYSIVLKGYHCHRTSETDDDSFHCVNVYEISVDGTYLGRLSGQNTAMTEDTPTHLWTQGTSTVTASKPQTCNDQLTAACCEGRLAEVQIFLSQGQDINCRTKSYMHRTLVILAAINGQEAVFDYLISRKCDLSIVDRFNKTVLYHACTGVSTHIVKKILQLNKYQLEIRGTDKKTPLMAAAYYCHRDHFDVLVKYGCNVTATDHRGQNSLHLASEEGCTYVVDVILTKDLIDKESRNTNGQTPLMVAAHACKVDVFSLLFTGGCNASAADKFGYNSLHSAIRHDCIVLVDYILSKDIINKESRDTLGRTPLLLAAFLGNIKMVKRLLTRNGDLQAVDTCNNTILHVAFKGGNVTLIKYLLTLKGLDWYKTNNIGETPLQLLEKMKAISGLFKPKVG